MSPSIAFAPPTGSNLGDDHVPPARMSVLVVDDNDSLRRSMCRHLKRGFNVLEASSGAEGLRFARESHPHVILLDAVMPDIDGHTALTILMNDPTTRDIPSVMISGLDDVGARIRALEAGAVDFVTKPIDPVELHARLLAAARRGIGPKETHESLGSNGNLRTRSEAACTVGRQLTEREALVVEALLSGLTEREIALTHGLAVGTIRSHKARIRRKLEIPPGTRFLRALQAILNSRHEPHSASKVLN